MNSTDVGQKGAARGSENDAGVLRADIQRVEELLNAEKRLRIRDLDLFVKKVAEYDNVVEKKEAVVIKEREKVKNLEVAIKSIQLASDKRKADLFEREFELAQLKIDNATLAEKSTQQEFELSKLKADKANLSEQANQHEVQVAELKSSVEVARAFEDGVSPSPQIISVQHASENNEKAPWIAQILGRHDTCAS